MNFSANSIVWVLFAVIDNTAPPLIVLARGNSRDARFYTTV